jgi:hypothetical protein
LGENWVTKNMEWRIFGKHEAKVNSAQEQQGLIHLHNTFCRERECHRCPLLLASSHGEMTGAGHLFYSKALKEVK